LGNDEACPHTGGTCPPPGGFMEAIPPLQGLTMLETSLSRGFAPCCLLHPVGAEKWKSKEYFQVL